MEELYARNLEDDGLFAGDDIHIREVYDDEI